MLLRTVTDWTCRGAVVLVSLVGCKALDERTITLHNGEECSNLRQCESLHCEVAMVSVNEPEVRICCSISCAPGSACAPSGTSCVVCPSGQCEGACAGDDCELDALDATKTESEKTSSTGNSTSSQKPATTSDEYEAETSRPQASDGPVTNSTSDAGQEPNSTAVSESSVPNEVASSSELTEAVTTDSAFATSTAVTSEEIVPPEEIPKCGEPLLINGDFENEMQAWTEETSYVGLSQRVHPMVVSADDDSVASYDAVAQSGSYFAYVGGVPDDEDRGHHSAIVQSIIVPTDAIAVWLRGYVWVTTDDDLDDEYDFGFVQLERTSQDEQYRQFDFWTNQDASTGWVAFEAVLEELGDLPGKRIRFLVGSITDEMGTTRFWFDALQLEGICD